MNSRIVNNIFIVTLVFCLLGCSVMVQKRTLTKPENISTLDEQIPFLKAHMLNGDVYVLTDWSVDNIDKTVFGNGTRYDLNRVEIEDGLLTVLLDSVTIFESNTVQNSGSVAALTIMTGASLAMTVFCITNPKACFGSCPTFYVDINGESKIVAEGFSSSVAPSLERTDIDALYNVEQNKNRLKIIVKNEALETHVINYANLLVIPRGEGRIYHDIEDNFYSSQKNLLPVKAVENDGDCLQEILKYDGIERYSLSDSLNLATKESIFLEFGNLPQDDFGIVIACRQSLLSTYLFYQALAFMGSNTGAWISSFEKMQEGFSSDISAVGQQLGGIEVFFETESGQYLYAGTINETGPLATDLHFLKIPQSDSYNGKVKLEITKGNFRIDYIAIASQLEQVNPIEITPFAVNKIVGSDENPIVKLLNNTEYLVSSPGDEYELIYNLPNDNVKYEFFLSSRGYYLEWMRQEWIKEENSEMAMMMFLNPQEALKILAPKYKAMETEMEDFFWNSKYAN